MFKTTVYLFYIVALIDPQDIRVTFISVHKPEVRYNFHI